MTDVSQLTATPSIRASQLWSLPILVTSGADFSVTSSRYEVLYSMAVLYVKIIQNPSKSISLRALSEYMCVVFPKVSIAIWTCVSWIEIYIWFNSYHIIGKHDSYWLAVSGCNPSENYECQLVWLFSTEWTIVPNHQPSPTITNQTIPKLNIPHTKNVKSQIYVWLLHRLENKQHWARGPLSHEVTNLGRQNSHGK